MKKGVIIAILILFVATGILFFVQKFEEVNREEEKQPIPSPTQYQPEPASFIIINFSSCQPQKKWIGFSFGSLVYEIKGITNNMCELSYGREVENPNWDRKLSTICKVPTSLGQIKFNKGDYGVDFTQIQQYCVEK